MTSSQPSLPARGSAAEVGKASDRQGIVMGAHVSSVAWAFIPEVRSLGLDGGERTEVILSPVRERNPMNMGVSLVERWELPTGVENAVLAVGAELLGWVSGHGLVGMPSLTAVYARQSLWIAVIDSGSKLPDFYNDPLSCSTGQRVLKYSEYWGVTAPPERGTRATWALMWADGRPVRTNPRALVSTRTA